ncbi:MAG: hypothetical protein LBE13_23045 [Bacteroidales bacterium]|jgi:hypothetical protein|nr:hypothetical protein [Bacteroidales bacterium]
MNAKKINESFPIITAIIMSIFTILLWWATSDSAKASKKVVEMEKHRQTLSLCKEYRDWFVYENNLTKTDSLLYELKIWEGSIIDQNKRNEWIKMSDTVQLEKILKNVSVRKLFSFFEDAMILHQKELLDDDYFYNFFYNPFRRLEKTNQPNVDKYITSMRTIYNDSLIYEGYYYCRDEILFLYEELNKNQKNAVEYVKKHEKITKEEYQNINKISSDKSLNELNIMVEKQFFIEIKKNNEIYYKL